MLKPPVTISIAFVHGMISGIQALGEPCDGFLNAAGIDPDLLDQVNARVTGQQYIALFELLIKRRGDDGLGFYSRRLKPGSFALTVRAALGAASLEVAMRRISRCFYLMQDDMVLTPVREGSLAGWSLHFSNPALLQPHFMHEMLLRIFWRVLAWLVGGSLPAVRFDLVFQRPPHAGSYGKLFPAPVLFEQSYSAFWFEAARLHDPIRRDEAALRVFLANIQQNIILPRRGDDQISTRVRLHLQRTCPAWPDLATTAQALNMSVSTLQRHLTSENIAFQALKDELRRDMAVSRLNTTTVSLSELAFELGFADSAAFQRAFKSWTGSAPGAYRRGIHISINGISAGSRNTG